MVKQKPEEKARQQIDKLLEGAGWTIQDYPEFNLGSSPGVGVREFPLDSGFTDYILFLERSAGGVLEAKPDTLRSRLKTMPSKHPLMREGLRDCQFEAIQNLELSLGEARQRALIQMATGSGKTYTAVSGQLQME